jgi:hypothetical protein
LTKKGFKQEYAEPLPSEGGFRPVKGLQESVILNRLSEIGDGTGVQGTLSIMRIGIRGYKYHGKVISGSPKPILQFQARKTRHTDIKDQTTGSPAWQSLQKIFGREKYVYLHTQGHEISLECLTHGSIVID